MGDSWLCSGISVVAAIAAATGDRLNPLVGPIHGGRGGTMNRFFRSCSTRLAAFLSHSFVPVCRFGSMHARVRPGRGGLGPPRRLLVSSTRRERCLNVLLRFLDSLLDIDIHALLRLAEDDFDITGMLFKGDCSLASPAAQADLSTQTPITSMHYQKRNFEAGQQLERRVFLPSGMKGYAQTIAKDVSSSALRFCQLYLCTMKASCEL